MKFSFLQKLHLVGPLTDTYGHASLSVSILIALTSRHLKGNMRIPQWTEHNPVVRPSRASESACWVILRVAISIMAPILEELREVSGSTTTLAIGAAILIDLKHRARVVTPTLCPQLVRALPINISGATDLVTCTIERVEVHRDVETIHKGDVIEIKVTELVQCKFGQCVGRDTPTRAMEPTGAVSGLATALAAAIEIAPGAAPNACHSSAGRHPKVPRLAMVQTLATAGAGSSPDGVRAVVDDLKVCCLSYCEDRGT